MAAALGLGVVGLGAGFGFSAGLVAAAELSGSVSSAALESLSGVVVESLSAGEAAFSAAVAAVVTVDLAASLGGGVAGADVAGAGVTGTLPLGSLLGLGVAG